MVPVAAAAVVDDHRASERIAQLRGKRPCDAVGCPARRPSHDEAHRLGRICLGRACPSGLGERVGGGEREREEKQSAEHAPL